MALATNGDKTGDKTKISEKDEKIIEGMNKFKEEIGSWGKLAKKIVGDMGYENGYLPETFTGKEEQEVIKAFTSSLKKSISERNQTFTTLNKQRIYFKDILNYFNRELSPSDKEITDTDTENYIKKNKEILNEKNFDWEKFKKEDLSKVKQAATQEYKEAQTLLGHFYYYHHQNGVRDVTQALGLYQAAAKQGDSLALYQLGLMYEYGDKDGDITPDKDKSYKFYKGSAEQDFSLALNKLAYHHFNKKEWGQFFHYAEKAKEKNDVIGMLYLAYAYQKGIGTNENIEKAIKLYKKLLDNIDAAPYRMEIQWTLAKLYKQSEKELTAQEYFDKAFETLKQGWKKVWEDNKLDIFEQMFNTTPDRYNNILAAAHYDYVHNPQKLTVISAFTGS